MLINQMFQNISLLILDQKIRIHKIVSENLGDYHADGTLSSPRHTYKNNIFH